MLGKDISWLYFLLFSASKNSEGQIYTHFCQKMWCVGLNA